MGASWFIALPVRRDDAEAFVASFPAPPPGLRLIPAADLHITIAFLGSVGEERARAAWDALFLPLMPLVATVGPVVPLGRPGHYSALGARLAKGRSTIETIIGTARDAATHAAGAEPETRPPLAHVTIARPRTRARTRSASRDAGVAVRSAGLDWAAKVPLGGPLHLETVALYTRRDNPSPASYYRIVTSRDLTSPPTAGNSPASQVDSDSDNDSGID